MFNFTLMESNEDKEDSIKDDEDINGEYEENLPCKNDMRVSSASSEEAINSIVNDVIFKLNVIEISDNFNDKISKSVLFNEEESLMLLKMLIKKCLQTLDVDSYQRYRNDQGCLLRENTECNEKILALEKLNAQAEADAYSWKTELESIKARSIEEKLSMQASLTSRLEAAVKQCEAAVNDKESMVVKFAMAEKEVLVVKKEKDSLLKKMKDIEKDKEILQEKIRNINTEKCRLSSTLDKKVQETGVANRTCNKLRDEINAKDIKIKWSESKLKTEIDAHKETQDKLDRALSKICGHSQDLESTREDALRSARKATEEEGQKIASLEKSLRETKAQLILETERYEKIRPLYDQLQSDHEKLKASYILSQNELTTFKARVSEHELERSESEKLFNSLQCELKNAKISGQESAAKTNRIADLEKQIERAEKRVSVLQEELEWSRSCVVEREDDLQACQAKESELLRCTKTLTERNAALQSQLSWLQPKVQCLESEKSEISKKLDEISVKLAVKEKERVDLEKNRRSEEERLTCLLSEAKHKSDQLSVKVADLENELLVQQKRYSNSLKDSNREVQKLRRKLENHGSASQQLTNHAGNSKPLQVDDQREEMAGESCQIETSAPSNYFAHENLSHDSRTSSEVSLNTTDSSSAPTGSRSFDYNGCSNNVPGVTVMDLPQHVFINRISKLQRELAKSREKKEFLEEHVDHLLREMQKKNKIIHSYVMREEPGALTDEHSDLAKSKLARHHGGGIMASLFGSQPRDDAMTLELSLEINRKLQAVLEDTLLKNIMMKDNLSTLGDEIAKLTLHNTTKSK